MLLSGAGLQGLTGTQARDSETGGWEAACQGLGAIGPQVLLLGEVSGGLPGPQGQSHAIFSSKAPELQPGCCGFELGESQIAKYFITRHLPASV